MRAVVGGARPDLGLLRGPTLLLGELQPLLERCWAPLQRERPRMQVVADALERLLSPPLARSLLRAPRIYLRSVRFGSFLSAKSHAPVLAERDARETHSGDACWMSSNGPAERGAWERWTAVPLYSADRDSKAVQISSSEVALRSDFGAFLSMQADRSVSRISWIGGWERVRVCARFAGGVELISFHGTRLAAPKGVASYDARPTLLDAECAASEWEIVPACDASPAIFINERDGRALDTGGDVAPGSAPLLLEANAHAYQRFSWNADGRLVACHARGLCVTAPALDGHQPTLELRSDALAERQCWNVKWEAATSAFRICLADGRMLDAAGGAVDRLCIWPSHSGSNQRWHVSPCF